MGHPSWGDRPFVMIHELTIHRARLRSGGGVGCPRRSIYVASMQTISARKMRDRMSAVLDGISRGEGYTITVHAQPVAELRPIVNRRRPFIPISEVLALLDRQDPDLTLAADMDWITSRF